MIGQNFMLPVRLPVLGLHGNKMPSFNCDRQPCFPVWNLISPPSYLTDSLYFGVGGLFPKKYLNENYERTQQGNLLESSVHFVVQTLILQFQQKL